MQKKSSRLIDGALTLFILIAFFFISLAIHSVFRSQALIPPLFILAVFLISLCTDGYIFGIASALIGVLAVNYAFTFPYFAFNFTIQENILSACILIFVTTATSTLTTKIKQHEKNRLTAEKEKMRADLLRAISHDLRTPLTAIYGSATTVAENFSVLSDEKKLDILRNISSDAQWLIRMVENLLSITKIDNSSVMLHKTPVVLEELIDSTIHKFKKNHPDCTVVLQIPDAFTMVSADPILIEQVLVNLLENAVQHAEGMTKLQLLVHLENTKAVFEVIDNGCGIEKEKLKSIFSGYYMTESSVPDNRKKCMGIGLSVCAAIIRAHGGEIFAENIKTGGMRFCFTLDTEAMTDE